jgi:hypothetical protein
MLTQSLPFGTLHIVLSKLAKAFIKKRWFSECFKYFEFSMKFHHSRILEMMERDLIAQSKTPNSLDPSDKKSLKFWELSALNYLHSCQFQEVISFFIF